MAFESPTLLQQARRGDGWSRSRRWLAQVEREEGFALLGLAADDADGLGSPQSLDEPAALLGNDDDLVGGRRFTIPVYPMGLSCFCECVRLLAAPRWYLPSVLQIAARYSS
jgi:hypothetical protein